MYILLNLSCESLLLTLCFLPSLHQEHASHGSYLRQLSDWQCHQCKMINFFDPPGSHTHTEWWWDLVFWYFSPWHRSLLGEVFHAGFAQGVQHLLPLVLSCRLLEALLRCLLPLLSQSDTQQSFRRHKFCSRRLEFLISYFILSAVVNFSKGIIATWMWRIGGIFVWSVVKTFLINFKEDC